MKKGYVRWRVNIRNEINGEGKIKMKRERY